VKLRTAAAAIGLVAIALATVATACGGNAGGLADPSATKVFADAPAPLKPSNGSGSAADGGHLAAPLWAFGLDLLSRQAAKSDGNVVVSPVSLSAVLSMTMNGARGETAVQMRKALRLTGLPQAAADQAWADLIAASNAIPRAEVRIADSLWLRDGVSYVPSFLAANRDYFAADARSLPSDLSAAPKEINAWVAERTAGRIKDLVSSVPPETALVLVNTVYAKVGWEHFDAAQTSQQPFTLVGGTKVQVPTMRGELSAPVATADEYTAVPVETNGELTFWVVVPKGAQTPESVAALLAKRGSGSLYKHPTYATVDLQLPRFRIEYESQNLSGDLSAMGMPAAFSSSAADFSGMANVRPLYISAVLQKAMIDVNEKGIEAAAGSAVIMAGAAPPSTRLTVRADRPFLVVLSGQITDAPLFMAMLRDPRSGGQGSSR
jgi:serpin B